MQRAIVRFCLSALLLLASGVQAEVSVAFVQAPRLLNESPQIAELKRQVREDFAPREQRLEEMQAQISMLQQQLDREGTVMALSEQRRLRHDISTRQLKYKHARDEINQDRQLRYNEEEERIARVIREVIEQVAQDEKIDIVLQSGVLWVSPKVDITDKILSRLQQLAKPAE